MWGFSNSLVSPLLSCKKLKRQPKLMSDVGQGEIEGPQSHLPRLELQWQVQEYVLEGKYLLDLKTSSVEDALRCTE